jgi:hypothetical protein
MVVATVLVTDTVCGALVTLPAGTLNVSGDDGPDGVTVIVVPWAAAVSEKPTKSKQTKIQVQVIARRCMVFLTLLTVEWCNSLSWDAMAVSHPIRRLSY